MRPLEELKKSISDTIERRGPYTHNTIGIYLMVVEKDYGISTANKIIDEFDLTKKFGIRKISLDRD